VSAELAIMPDWAFLSASGLERASVDPWAYALKADPADDESESAARGTAIHSFFERHDLGFPRELNLSLCDPSVFETCWGISFDGVPPAFPELAWVYDVKTRQARMVKREVHRSYGPLGEYEIPGTADRMIAPMHNDGIARVEDIKTGYESVPDARGCLQLGFFALCLQSFAGCDRVEVAIRRVDDEGRQYVDSWVMDALDLEEMHDRIAALHAGVKAAREARLRGDKPAVRAGSHCKWCPSKGSCPVYAREASGLGLLGDDWVDEIRQRIASNDDAAHWWEKANRASEVVDAVQKLLRERIAQSPITLPDGRTVALASETRRRINGKQALALMAEMYGADVAEVAADVTVTQKSISDAFGDLAPQVMDALDQNGAVSRFEIQKIRTTKPKAKKAPKALPARKKGPK
jgi:hypothetical protein